MTSAIEALYASHAERVFGFLLLRCGSRALAEDLTAETFLAASELCSKGREAEITPAWLFTVARRRLIDSWRRRSSQRTGLQRLANQTDTESPPPDDPDDRVDRALQSLPERQRAALVLRYLDEFAVSEVAEALGTSYKATESILSRARRAFATAYELMEP